jgi:hypothetical protein
VSSLWWVFWFLLTLDFQFVPKEKRNKKKILFSRNFIFRYHLRLYGNRYLCPDLNIVIGECSTLENYAIFFFLKRSLCEELTKDKVTSSIFFIYFSYGFQSLTNYLRFSIISSLFELLFKGYPIQTLTCKKTC